MRWNSIIELVSIGIGQDEMLQEIETETRRSVRANAWSIGFDERVSSGIDALRGAHRFELQRQMYQGEKKAYYNGKPFRVDADVRGQRVILTLTEVNDENG